LRSTLTKHAKSLPTWLIAKPSRKLMARGLRASPDRTGPERTFFDTVLVAKVVQAGGITHLASME
jgi:hypothetical protein